MPGYANADYADPILVVTSAGVPDPYVIPDGTWSVTGSVAASVDLSAGGDISAVGDVGGATLTITGDGTIGGQLFIADGTAADPALAFTGDVDTGLAYLFSGVGVCIGGLLRHHFTSTAYVPGADNGLDLGAPTAQWKDAHIAGAYTHTQAVVDAGTPTAFTLTGGAHTACVASTEVTDVLFDLGRTITWATGTLANQRSVKFLAPTLDFAAASSVTACATVYIDNAPQPGAQATLDAAYALWVDAGASRFDGKILVADGTAGAPSIQWASDPDMGFYQGGANEILVSAGSAAVFKFAGTNISYVNLTPDGNNTRDLGASGTAWKDFHLAGDATIGGQIFLAEGTVGAPAITMGDPDTGLYGTLGAIRFACDGGLVARAIPTSFQTYVPILPGANNTYDLGETSTPLKWRDLHLAGNANIGGQVFIADGSAANPAIALTSDVDTGLYGSDGTIRMCVSGNDLWRITSARTGFYQPCSPNSDVGTHLGESDHRWDDFHQAGAHLMSEMTAPSGTANKATIYAVDNGSGKTQLMCIFGTGSAVQIAIEP